MGEMSNQLNRRGKMPAIRFGLLILAAVIVRPAFAQPAQDDVDQLRLILRTPFGDPAARDSAIKGTLARLRGLGDLRRALLLPEWRNAAPSGAEAQVDVLNRALLADRFLADIRAVLQRADAVTAGVVVDMISEMSTTLRKQGEITSFMRPLGPDLAALTALQ